MGSRESETTVTFRERLAPRRTEPADLFCMVTLAGALLTAAAGSIDATLFLAATVVAMLGARHLRLPTAFELSVAVGVVLQGWGNALLLFERIGWYDKAVHFLTPLLLIPPLYMLLARAEALPSVSDNRLRRGTAGVFITTAALGVALAAAWELVEGTADRLLGMSLAHGYFETIDDLYCSLLGSVAAGAMLAWIVSTGRNLDRESTGIEALLERQ